MTVFTLGWSYNDFDITTLTHNNWSTNHSDGYVGNAITHPDFLKLFQYYLAKLQWISAL